MEELACLLPPSVPDRLPERHLASFRDAFSMLDPHEPKAPHTGVGSGQLNPQIGRGNSIYGAYGELDLSEEPVEDSGSCLDLDVWVSGWRSPKLYK